jgi:hypothetical protein
MKKSITKAEAEQLIAKMVESRLHKAIEEFVQANELRLKELSVIERVVRVEEELKSLREISEVRFEALQREMSTGFGSMEKRFSLVQWMIGIFVGVPALIIALAKVLEILK